VTERFVRLDYSAENCSVTRALGVVGEKWTLLILREAFLGLRRFEEFHLALGCARNLLSDRLRTLVANGLLERLDYREPGQRARAEYALTRKGGDLLPVVIALLNWGDKWVADTRERPLLVSHRCCGGEVKAELVCERGHHIRTMDDLAARAGPGAIRVTRGSVSKD
jgi:DNA-binding HxlR family transcriptional regulator